ncbi:SLC13 family permease [Marinomonas pollencensis]|uniref:Di/tricarboxylate transporter n=1 Tax=Marinomonas pollencensis TaxID=491954 RepID=A0A3E0D791_9GAMM|nr:SLC13 family permease [Marinomonas pollencensis]REG78457.1 di/tricarboxylate transporter [Marinomonas pollencensis]
MDMLFTLILVATVFIALVTTRIAADVILMAAMGCLVISGVLTVSEGLAGFANPGVMTIAILYIVAAGLQETGAVQWLSKYLLGNPKGLKAALARLIVPSALLSAFMNNTAVVAMFIPAVQYWSKRIKLPTSKLLIPLSYAAILGGTCTVIGTSTNLVIDGLLQKELGIHLNIFSLLWVGLPITLVGGGLLFVLSKHLLPNRESTLEQADNARQYGVEMRIEKNSRLIGKSIEQAGLRALQFGYLFEIHRDSALLSAVGSETQLYENDTLVFIGSPECAREIQNIQGLRPVDGGAETLEIEHNKRCLVEAVIGPEFVGLGSTIKEAKFRTRFQAAVLSVSRKGHRINSKIGNIQLQVGDTLLLETSQDFVGQYRSRRDFLLVSAINDSTPPNFDKAPLAVGLLLALVLLSATGLLSILEAAMLCAAAMLGTRCITVAKARRNVNLNVITVIAASFSLGAAMTKTGAAELIASHIVTLTPYSPWLSLALIYLITVIFTEMITNNAAAVLMFPIAIATANQLQSDPLPFVITIMIAASASFITPIGYQTNLMVMGPGGYKTRDFIKAGLPISLAVGASSIAIIPFIWPFYG